jgi:hypothetical protein
MGDEIMVFCALDQGCPDRGILLHSELTYLCNGIAEPENTNSSSVDGKRSHAEERIRSARGFAIIRRHGFLKGMSALDPFMLCVHSGCPQPQGGEFTGNVQEQESGSVVLSFSLLPSPAIRTPFEKRSEHILYTMPVPG